MIEAKIGKVREHDGQRYECVRMDPYVRRSDGALSTLAVWRSPCAQCGTMFDFRTPRQIKRFEPVRRCKRHRQPGTRVQKTKQRAKRLNVFA